MTVRLPDPQNSRAVLIGTSSYDNPDLKPLLAVRNNLEVLQELLTSDNGGFLPRRCDVVQDFPEPREVCRRIREAAREASDTLLVYFSGHGILGYDGELHLALTGTDEGDLRWTSVPIGEIRHIFETAACRNKILILDCCHSGSVLDSMMSAPNGEPAPLDIRGTYVLVSSPAAFTSYAPPEDRYTAFTGELIQLLRDGVPGAPELLPLSALFAPLTAAMKQRSLPCPRQQGSDGYSSLALVRNMATAESDERDAVRAGPAVRERDSDRPAEIHLAHATWYPRMWQWGIGAPVMLGLAWAGLTFGPKGQERLDLTSVVGIVSASAIGAMFLITTGLSDYRPTDYSLTISSDGIEVRYTTEHFYYPWHRVSRVWVEERPGGRLRSTRYVLLLRPKPGVHITTGRAGAPGPRRDVRTGALRFANLRHLNAPPASVEQALRRNAGSAWTPSIGMLGQPAPEKEAVEIFSTDRLFLTVVAAAAAFVGYVVFPESALTRPARLLIMIGPVLVCGAMCAVLGFCISRIVHPVRLKIGAAGLALTRGSLDIAYAWSEIERIGVITWPGLSALGLVALKPTAQAGHAPLDRTTAYLPGLALGCVTLCSLPEVTRSPHRLTETLQHFAAQSQLTPAGHGWLRSTPARAAAAAKATVARSSGTTFTGLRSWWVALLLGVTSGFAGLLLASLVSEADPPGLLETLIMFVCMQLYLPVLFAYFLTDRHRLTLDIGTSGLALTVFGPRVHTLRVPWSDIDSIGIVVRQNPIDIVGRRYPRVMHSVVLWLGPGVRPPRSLWWSCPHEYGGLRLIRIESSRLDTVPEQLDRAIAHHAGHRYSPMQRLPPPGQAPASAD